MPTNPPGELDQLQAECRRLAEALALVERDRQFLGYEIHDGVVQDLTAAVMLLEGAGHQATFTSPEGQDNYAGGVRLLHESIAEARRLIRGLATVELDDRGLASALERLATKFRADHGLPVTFASDGKEWNLPASVQHLLLRVAQESLYNVWKHARASRVELRLAGSDGRLELSIADNGVGFDPARAPAGHFGLAGIRARVAVLGADLLLDTAPAHGTRIVVRLKPPPTV